MSIAPASPEELIKILQYRHRVMLASRTSKMPGEFKDKNNFAGDTTFVDFNLVKGTLIKGFNYYHTLTSPFAKAIFMMFMTSEIHPFLDDNGRIARVMMNAELSKAGESKIIIPNVFISLVRWSMEKILIRCENFLILQTHSPIVAKQY
ncbi:MAG: Fic family protein [Bacteroidales bacterium]